MTEWNTFYENIIQEVDRLLEEENCDLPLFRGENNRDNQLLPTLFRDKLFTPNVDLKDIDLQQVERNLFLGYESHSAILHRNEKRDVYNSWEILYEMRHHGIPTRLLDWTASFAVALYFAIKKDVNNPYLWILNPYTLNSESSLHSHKIVNIEKFKDKDYENSFLRDSNDSEYSKPFDKPIAIFPIKNHPRLVAQSGFFTVHGVINKPINQICPNAVKKFVIPEEIIPDAKKFLKLVNINEYSLFPDLDGLARYLKETQSCV